MLEALLKWVIAGGMRRGITKGDGRWEAKVEATEGDVVVGAEKLVGSSLERLGENFARKGSRRCNNVVGLREGRRNKGA